MPTHPPPPEDPIVAGVEAILQAAASRSGAPETRPDGRVIATHAIWLCACMAPDDAPVWLIHTVDADGIGWQRIPDGTEVADVIDAEHLTGSHLEPGEVLQWLRGDRPWLDHDDSPEDAFIYQELRRRTRAS